MRSSVAVLRACRVVLHLLYGALLALAFPRLARRWQNRLLQTWACELLSILNVRLHAVHPQRMPASEGGMVVANHISWLDIFVLNAVQPACFIAKGEVRGWPLIGWLCQRSGTIFIKRGLRRDAASTNRRIGALLRQGVRVGLFPEGTTTGGEHVAHFHSALIQPAIDAGATLYPVALHYSDSGARSGGAVAFTGDATLAQSVWRILLCRRIEAAAIFTPPLTPAGRDRRALAQSAQAAIARALQSMPPARAIPDGASDFFSAIEQFTIR